MRVPKRAGGELRHAVRVALVLAVNDRRPRCFRSVNYAAKELAPALDVSVDHLRRAIRDHTLDLERELAIRPCTAFGRSPAGPGAQDGAQDGAQVVPKCETAAALDAKPQVDDGAPATGDSALYLSTTTATTTPPPAPTPPADAPPPSSSSPFGAELEHKRTAAEQLRRRAKLTRPAGKRPSRAAPNQYPRRCDNERCSASDVPPGDGMCSWAYDGVSFVVCLSCHADDPSLVVDLARAAWTAQHVAADELIAEAEQLVAEADELAAFAAIAAELEPSATAEEQP